MTANSRGTRTRAAILMAIVGYWDQHHCGPSIEDIAEMVRRDTSTVRYHLDLLERAGQIRRTPGVPRSVELVEKETQCTP